MSTPDTDTHTHTRAHTYTRKGPVHAQGVLLGDMPELGEISWPLRSGIPHTF